jgi:hydroxyacylglutathione hydrolase
MAIQIHPIAVFNDNYIWAVVEPKLKKVLLVDPGDGESCVEYIKQHGLELSAILITHHHADHTGGIDACREAFPEIEVYGPSYSKQQSLLEQYQHQLADGDCVNIKTFGIDAKIIYTPGHTLDHICYYDAPNKLLFCGDTLFAGGCGRIFEGDAAQMYQSLSRLAALPDDTAVYCAHEYTAANLKFALAAEPANQDLQQRYLQVKQLRQDNQITLPSDIGLEKRTNPFLRCHLPSLHKSIKQQQQLDPKQTLENVEVFAWLRQWKDNF